MWTSDVLSGPVRCVHTDGGVAEGWAAQGAWHGACRRWRGDGSLELYGRSVHDREIRRVWQTCVV